jgi:hypothetical protein
VRVNAITGETRVSHFLGSFDCGRILGPPAQQEQRTAFSDLRHVKSGTVHLNH